MDELIKALKQNTDNVDVAALNLINYQGYDIFYSVISEKHGSRVWTRYNIYIAHNLDFECIGAIVCPNPITSLELTLRAYNVLKIHNRGAA